MKKFDFNCPQCGKAHRCNDPQSGEVFQCPDCGHCFVPADTQHKNCPFCGKEILARAVKCRYCRESLEKRRKHFVLPKPLLTVLLLCALLGGGIVVWETYSGFQSSRLRAYWEKQLAEKQRKEALRQEEERRRAKEEAERNARQTQMIEEGKRRAAKEAEMREEDAKKRAAEEAKRRIAEEELRLQKEAEEKAQRERAEAERRARQMQEIEERRKAARRAEENETQLRRARQHLTFLRGQLRIENEYLIRAFKRENDSHAICQRKMMRGKHKYRCTCCDKDPETFTWDLYQASRAACCKAYIAAVLQRRKKQQEINALVMEVEATENKIRLLKKETTDNE